MVIPKENALFKTRAKPKVNVQLCWISLFSKSSWIKTTASCLAYELDVNGFCINGVNFNSLKEVICIILWHCYLEID